MVIAIGIMINVWRAKVRESIGCIKESFITILITTAILAGSPAIRGAVPEVYIFSIHLQVPVFHSENVTASKTDHEFVIYAVCSCF